MRTRFIASIISNARDTDVVLPWSRKDQHGKASDAPARTATP